MGWMIRGSSPSRGYHSPLSIAEVKNAWDYTSTPPMRLYGVGQFRLFLLRNKFTMHLKNFQDHLPFQMILPEL
jgi:hypothetical protein